MSNRLYILLDAFLIEVFLLYSMVFARLCCGGLLLGVVLAVAYEYEPPLFDVCLPCDACILGGFSGSFSGFFWLVLVFFGLGAARTPFIELYIIRRKGQ